jgi:hypothetical protein
MAIYYAGNALPSPEGGPPRPGNIPILRGHVVPGPEPVRRLVAEHNLADRGSLTPAGLVRQRRRYAAPAIARSTLEAVLATVASALLSTVIDHPRAPLVLSLAPAALWVRAGIITVVALVRAHLYAVTFHQRGFEVATGILNRRKRFIWYYQLTEEPHYVRTPGMFVTHTASLQISYNDDAHTARRLELAGIGSPREVEAIRSYIELRRLAERSPIRGPLT